MTNAAPPQPERIRTARELRGLTQKDVVGRMGRPISASALSQIEAGKIQPSNETLHDLASVLEVPVAYFHGPWRNLRPDDRPSVFFRHLRATPVREQRRAMALAALLADLVAAIETRIRLPDVDFPTARAAEDDPVSVEHAALGVRKAWGLGEGPIPSVVHELEAHGAVVARLLMGHQHVDAFSARLGYRPLVMLTDDKQSYVRSRFDAAHELGHLVLHRTAEPGTRLVEAQAHQFASRLLFPRDAAADELPRRLSSAGWGRMAEIKRRWGISMAAQLRVGHEIGIFGPDEYRNAMKYMSSRGWRRVEPGDREMGPPEPPQLLERALSTLSKHHGWNTEDFVDSIGLPIDDTLELIERATDSRPTVSL